MVSKLFRQRRPPKRREPKGYRAILSPVQELRHARHSIHHVGHFLEKHLEHPLPREGKEFRPRIHFLSPEQAERIVGAGIERVVGLTVEIEGLNISDEAIAELEERLRAIMAEGGGEIVEMAQSIAPVQTGFLRDRVWYKIDDELLMLTVGDDAFYAGYVEEGTSRMASQPYLQPAINVVEPSLQAEIDEVVFDAMETGAEEQGDEGTNTMLLEMETETETVAEVAVAA